MGMLLLAAKCCRDFGGRKRAMSPSLKGVVRNPAELGFEPTSPRSCVSTLSETHPKWSMASFHTATASGVAWRSRGEDQTTAWSQKRVVRNSAELGSEPTSPTPAFPRCQKHTQMTHGFFPHRHRTVSGVAWRSCGEDQTSAWSETASHAQQPAQVSYPSVGGPIAVSTISSGTRKVTHVSTS
jgi:hypothetical protein